MSDSLSLLESKAIAFLAEHANKRTAVSFSGGKDSLVALDLAYRVGIRRAVFCDTTIEFDETIHYVEDVARFYGISIDVVKPPLDFFTLMEHVTAPSRRQRWCCEVFKFGPLSKWALENEVVAFVTGLRKEESHGRTSYSMIDRNPIMPVLQINPLLEWSEEMVWSYIRQYNLPVNPLYQYFSRVGCWCCPYKTSSEWEMIRRVFPDKAAFLHRKLSDLADRLGIRDKRRFVDEYGWTYWVYPTRRVTVGTSTVCRGSEFTTVVVSSEDEAQLERITAILPVLSTDFKRVGNRLRISIAGFSERRLQILIERAMNCVGCGACLSYCATGALRLEQGHISVDESRCTHCQACLNAATLKGSCIARHYSPRRSSLLTLVKSPKPT
ncbi:MAG: phosphoadenosine phosphosulfate reductase family protein [Candidatus Thorarchaeota archaeon]